MVEHKMYCTLAAELSKDWSKFRPLGQAASRPLCKLSTSEITPQQVTIAVAVETFWCGEGEQP